MSTRLNPIRLLILVCVLLSLPQAHSQAAAHRAPAPGQPDQAVLTFTTVPGQPQLTAEAAVYESPSTAAPRPFTHMLLRWEASVPPSATLKLELRASHDGSSWTPWGAVMEDEDLWVAADGSDAHWSQPIYAGTDMRFWQLRATPAPSPTGAAPSLRRVEVNTVDARFGAAQPQAGLPKPSLTGVARPAVVSRSSWGSPDGQGSRVSPAYYPVNHMVVHHTADPNTLGAKEASWADRVRAIWAFHTFTREWGDIGYNYLIDPNGVIYEGRAGGDDAVAFHDTANYGSLGVVLLGTYTSVDPRPATLDSLVELLAWKADQKRIDPLGRSFYYGCSRSTYCAPFTSNAIVENIAGHRQVTPGHTSCPGEAALAYIPGVRQRVQARLNGDGSGEPGDDGDLLIDELERSFQPSEALWYGVGCGYGGHAQFTYATDTIAESINWATWTPNLPSAGSYRVLVYLPSDCDLGTPTSAARYRISAADGVHEVVIDQSANQGWVDLGSYRFAAGRASWLRLDDLTGEPYAQRRLVLFDSARFVPEQSDDRRLELLDVGYDRDTLAAGELLKVTFTVRNAGSVPLHTQDPQAGTMTDALASFDGANGYVYDETECFLGSPGQSYPTYPKEADRFRVMLGPVDRELNCAGGTSGYPWRWGLDGPLAPGETRAINAYVRFREPGTLTLRAGAIREYVRYESQSVFTTTITVTPERQAPAPIQYDAQLRPLAQVYRLGDIPDNLLARTLTPISIVKGAAVGSFAWEGDLRDWGAGGPLPGLDNSYIIEQTRTFIAPVAGSYTFQLTSDDGAWMWINGAPLLAAPGLHPASTISGTIHLAAGRHVLALKYFERSGGAVLGYSVRMPDGAGFGPLIDGLGGGGSEYEPHLGGSFKRLRGLTLAADDLGGSGAVRLRWSWDGVQWQEEPGGVLTIGGLVDGEYTLSYQAIDAAGNASPASQLRLRVDSSMVVHYAYLPVVLR